MGGWVDGGMRVFSHILITPFTHQQEMHFYLRKSVQSVKSACNSLPDHFQKKFLTQHRHPQLLCFFQLGAGGFSRHQVIGLFAD